MLLLCGAAQHRPHAACKTAWAERGAARMHPGAICLQPLNQMVCKDSWGGGVGREYIYQAPSLSRSL